MPRQWASTDSSRSRAIFKWHYLHAEAEAGGESQNDEQVGKERQHEGAAPGLVLAT